jgi:hypothetical protein
MVMRIAGSTRAARPPERLTTTWSISPTRDLLVMRLRVSSDSKKASRLADLALWPSMSDSKFYRNGNNIAVPDFILPGAPLRRKQVVKGAGD